MKYLLLLFIDTWYLHLISFHKRVLQSSQRAAFFFLFFIPEIGRRIAIVYVQKKKHRLPREREREKKNWWLLFQPTSHHPQCILKTSNLRPTKSVLDK